MPPRHPRLTPLKTHVVAISLLFLPSLSQQQASRKVDLIIRGGAIITMDSERRIIEDGFLAVAQDRIVEVGRRADLESRYTAGKVIEAQGRAVLPGLINLHTHSFMILFRGLADDYTVDTWGQALGPLHRDHDDRPGFRKWGNALAGLEMLKRGTTTFVEMYQYPELVAQVAQEAGLRAIVTLRLPFVQETGQFDPANAEAEFEKLVRSLKGDALITPGLAAHGPHTVPAHVLRFTKQLADQYDVPLVIHLAEGAAESEQIRRQFGKTPTEYLDNLGFLSGRVLAIHGIRLNDTDIGILKTRGVSIAHNPESNAKLASGVARIPDLLTAGITVGLGTDSAVSNNNLDMFEEMDMAVKLQRAVHQDWKVLTARQALEMATIQGAAAIHMEKDIGSLEAGKKADLIVVDLDKPELQPVYDYYSHLVYVARGADVDTSIVNGRVLMEGRRVVTMDEGQIKTKAVEYRQMVVDSLKK